MKWTRYILPTLLFALAVFAFWGLIQKYPEALGQTKETATTTPTTKTIIERTATATPSQKVSIVSDEIVAKADRSTFTKNGVQVEIQSIEKIDGGIAVLAKAWSDGQPIGFGADGSVEIERFKIYNPQFTVEDPAGDIVQDFVTLTGNHVVTRAKEDVTAALRAELLHTISVKKEKFVGSTKIVPGKIGNTTSTFNPASGATSPVDGVIFVTKTTWDLAHDAVAGDTANVTVAQELIAASRSRSSPDTTIWRGFFLFDTSAIPDTDTISAATLSVWVASTQNADNDGNDFLAITTATPASDSTLATADFDQCGTIDSPTQMHDDSQRKDITSISISAYLDTTFNATGISNVSKTGLSRFCYREGHDWLDSPFSPVSPNYNYVEVRYRDDLNGTPPKLVVEHAAAGGGGAVESQPIIMFDDV